MAKRDISSYRGSLDFIEFVIDPKNKNSTPAEVVVYTGHYLRILKIKVKDSEAMFKKIPKNLSPEEFRGELLKLLKEERAKIEENEIKGLQNEYGVL